MKYLQSNLLRIHLGITRIDALIRKRVRQFLLLTSDMDGRTTNLPQPVFVKIKLICAENNSEFFLLWFML